MMVISNWKGRRERTSVLVGKGVDRPVSAGRAGWDPPLGSLEGSQSSRLSPPEMSCPDAEPLLPWLSGIQQLSPIQ